MSSSYARFTSNSKAHEYKIDRRLVLRSSVLITAPTVLLQAGCSTQKSIVSQRNDVKFTEWLDHVIGKKSFDSPAVLSKFSDGFYYLRSPIAWRPNKIQDHLSPVTVPTGFVTDLASIPRWLWPVLPRDGSYADAAIVHDYLYWTQKTSRETADLILKVAMEDLETPPATVSAIFAAVRSPFGLSAWNRNSALKSKGESRFLKTLPSDPKTSWEDWKDMPNTLAPNE